MSLAETEINGDGSGNTKYSNGLIVHQQFAPANSGGCMTVPNSFVHSTLETFGHVPLFGEPFDILDGIAYAVEGDFANASLSLGAAVPGLGYISNGYRWTNRAAKAGKVFWSGGNLAKDAAMKFAKENGMKTLEMTLGGRVMTRVGPILPKSISGPMWSRLSSNFAKSAEGIVNVFHNASTGFG